jgi:hypothetical protein
MSTVTVPRADVTTDEVSAALSQGPGPGFHVLPGVKTSLLIAAGEPGPGLAGLHPGGHGPQPRLAGVPGTSWNRRRGIPLPVAARPCLSVPV